MMNGKRIMAGRLLCTALAAVLVQGCLIPQEDPVLPDLPPKRNTPPVLVLDSATPMKRGTTLFLNPSCMSKDRRFAIAVVDPDLGDKIVTRWFVDHDDKFTTLPVNGTEFPSGAKFAERGIAKPIELFYTSGRLFDPPGAHWVTVVISDRAFLPEGIDVTLGTFDLPDGGTTPDMTTTAQYTWEVITDKTNCP